LRRLATQGTRRLGLGRARQSPEAFTASAVDRGGGPPSRGDARTRAEVHRSRRRWDAWPMATGL